MRIDIKVPEWIARPNIRQSRLLRVDGGWSMECSGMTSRIFKFGPLWVYWPIDVVR